MKRILGVLISSVMLAVTCLTALPVSAKEEYTEYIVPFYSDQTKQKQVVGISNKSLLKDGVVLIPLETACEIAGASIAEENDEAVIITRNYVSWCYEYGNEDNQYLLIDSNTGKGNYYESALDNLSSISSKGIFGAWNPFDYSVEYNGFHVAFTIDDFHQTKVPCERYDNELYVSFYEFLVMMGVNVELIDHEAINEITEFYTSMAEEYSDDKDYKAVISEIDKLFSAGTGYEQFFFCSLGTPIDELYKAYYDSDLMCDLGDYYGDGSVEWANLVNAVENYNGFTKTALAALNLNTDYEDVLINTVTYHGDSEEDDFSKKISEGIDTVNTILSVNDLFETIEDATKEDDALRLAWNLQQDLEDFNPVLSNLDADLNISKDSDFLSDIGKTCSIIESAKKYRELEDLFEFEQTLLKNTILASGSVSNNYNSEAKGMIISHILNPTGNVIKIHNNLRNKENSYFNLCNSASKVQITMDSSCPTVVGVIYDTIIDELTDKADEKILKTIDKVAFYNVPVTQLANAGIKCAGSAISNTAYGKDQSRIAELDDYVFLQEVAEDCFKEHSPDSENAHSSFILGLKSTMLAYESTNAGSSGEIHGGGGRSFDSNENNERKGNVPEELYGLLDQSVSANVDFYNAFPKGCDDLTEMLGSNTDISMLDTIPRQEISLEYGEGDVEETTEPTETPTESQTISYTEYQFDEVVEYNEWLIYAAPEYDETGYHYNIIKYSRTTEEVVRTTATVGWSAEQILLINDKLIYDGEDGLHSYDLTNDTDYLLFETTSKIAGVHLDSQSLILIEQVQNGLQINSYDISSNECENIKYISGAKYLAFVEQEVFYCTISTVETEKNNTSECTMSIHSYNISNTADIEISECKTEYSTSGGIWDIPCFYADDEKIVIMYGQRGGSGNVFNGSIVVINKNTFEQIMLIENVGDIDEFWICNNCLCYSRYYINLDTGESVDIRGSLSFGHDDFLLYSYDGSYMFYSLNAETSCTAIEQSDVLQTSDPEDAYYAYNCIGISSNYVVIDVTVYSYEAKYNPVGWRPGTVRKEHVLLDLNDIESFY